MLEVRDLVVVRAIAEHGSLARAARVLAVGQPALTRSLAGLEARLRGPLFERNRRGVVPTDLCRALLAEAGEILERLERLDRHLAEVRGGQTRTLPVIAGAYAAETTVLVAAARMLELFPTIRIGLRTANWADIPAAVREREAAIGVMDVGGLGEAADLEVELLLPMPGILVVRPGHPLAVPGVPLDLARIVAFPFVLLGRLPRRVQAPLAQAREAARQAGQLHPAFPALVLESPTEALKAVQESNAVAGSTAAVAEAAVRAGQVAVLPWREEWMQLQPGIVRLRRRPPSEAESAFLDLLRTADREAAARADRFLAEHGLALAEP